VNEQICGLSLIPAAARVTDESRNRVASSDKVSDPLR